MDDEILESEAALIHAQLTGEVTALDNLLDDNLLFTSFDGTIASKSDDLAMHRSGRLRITKMEPSNRRILHLGVTSVVSVLMDAAAIIDGNPVTANMRYTRVWHRFPGQWRVVAGHMSPAPSSGA